MVYDNTFGQGQHTAQFWLMVDNNSGTDVVATIDVVTNYGSNNLAQRLIRRNEFVAANQWQVFTLEFNNPCFGLVESRVWWSDTVNMKFSQVSITATNTSAVDFEWLVADHLGTPRMVVNKSGTWAGVKRHDYLPFGEELYAGVSSRTVEHGYTGDGVRQKFTAKERDNETGLDYFLARYYTSTQGRFIGPDDFTGGPTELFAEVAAHNPTFYAELAEPQSLNKYHYALNNPLRFTDPDGHQSIPADMLRVADSLNISVPDVYKGEAKAAANIFLGMGNVTAAFTGGEPTALYTPSNKTQAVMMIVTDRVALFAGLSSGRPQVGGVAVAETNTTAQVAAISVANEAQALRGANRPGAAGALVATNGQTVTTTSRSGGINAGVQGALDKVPASQRSDFHGKCCEPRLISKAQDAGINVQGAEISVVRVRAPGNPLHGTPLKACSSCRAVLDFAGIKY